VTRALCWCDRGPRAGPRRPPERAGAAREGGAELARPVGRGRAHSRAAGAAPMLHYHYTILEIWVRVLWCEIGVLPGTGGRVYVGLALTTKVDRQSTWEVDFHKAPAPVYLLTVGRLKVWTARVNCEELIPQPRTLRPRDPRFESDAGTWACTGLVESLLWCVEELELGIIGLIKTRTNSPPPPRTSRTRPAQTGYLPHACNTTYPPSAPSESTRVYRKCAYTLKCH